jgi:hypothetical protein
MPELMKCQSCGTTCVIHKTSTCFRCRCRTCEVCGKEWAPSDARATVCSQCAKRSLHNRSVKQSVMRAHKRGERPQNATGKERV